MEQHHHHHAKASKSAGSMEGAGSLWIDYLLLPHQLDHHLSQLAAGSASTPSPTQLILMFLDQALLSHKAASSSTDKEAPAAFYRQLTGNTAALLCERAATVAASMGLTLDDIEAIPSPQHQYLLLQALIHHDPNRSLIHNCNLHRWLLHNILHSDARVPALSSLMINGNIDAAQNATANSKSNTPTPGTSSFVAAEENNSICFLENILREEEKVHPDSSPNQTIEHNSNESPALNHTEIQPSKVSRLSKGYRCQVILDVAEVHFMRGRIGLAHDLFTKSGQLLAEFISSKEAGDKKMTSVVSTESDWNPYLLMQKDRIIGLIMACRMILGMHKFMTSSEVEHPEGIYLNETPLKDLNAPSAAAQSVIVCEQSRWVLRRTMHKDAVFKHGIQTDICSRQLEHLGQNESEKFSTAMQYPQSKQDIIPEISEGMMEKEEPPRKIRKVSEDVLCSKSLEKHSLMSNKSADILATCAEDLSRTFIEDLMTHDLPWDYRHSLEKDLCIPVSTRCQLMACNLLQDALMGDSVESFLYVSEYFFENREATEFLMRTIAEVLKRLGGYDNQCREREINESQLLSESINRKTNSYSVGKVSNEMLVSRLLEFVKYVCCMLDKPWCWAIASESALLTDVQIQNLRQYSSDLQLFSSVHMNSRIEHLVGSLEESSFPEIKGKQSCQYHAKSDVGALLHVMQAESFSDLQDHFCFLDDSKDSVFMQVPQDAANMSLQSKGLQTCICDDKFQGVFCKGKPSCYCRNAVTMASVLWQKAFNAVESKAYRYAVCMFKMLRLLSSKNIECDLMLWLLETQDQEHGKLQEAAMSLPKINTLKTYPSIGLVEYCFVKLIDNEQWVHLCEFCKWVTMLGEAHKEGGDEAHSSTFEQSIRQLYLMASLATCLEKIFHLSTSLQAIPTCSEEAICSTQTLHRVFEEFMQSLIGVDVPVQKDNLISDSKNQLKGNQSVMAYSSIYEIVREAPIIFKLSNPKLLTCLASCTVGWLQSCHVVGITPWPFDVKRYGALATALAGISLLPQSGGVATHKDAPLLIPPGLCREMFHLFLERLVTLPTLIEGSVDNGYVWLQGLADLAFEDNNHIEALRYYLQAGSIKSAHYCICEFSMLQDVFTPWVI